MICVLFVLKKENDLNHRLPKVRFAARKKKQKNARRGMLTNKKKRGVGTERPKFSLVMRPCVVSYRPKLLFVALERLERLELLSVKVR